MASVELPGQVLLRTCDSWDLLGRRFFVAGPLRPPMPRPRSRYVTRWRLGSSRCWHAGLDVASHTTQCRSHPGRCRRVLAEVIPTAPEIPHIPATLGSARATAHRRVRKTWRVHLCDSRRRYRPRSRTVPSVGELARKTEQNAASLDMPTQRLPRCGAEQLPFGLRLAADAHNAGAKVDFSVQHPDGRLVDAIVELTHRHPDAQP